MLGKNYSFYLFYESFNQKIGLGVAELACSFYRQVPVQA